MTIEPQKKKRIIIPKDFDSASRKLLAKNVIDFIKERTDKSVDVDGKKFHPYSKSYVESDNFQIAGKSKGDVNLRLTNEMMESIELLEDGPGYITIGFEEGTDANNKAVWNERSDNGPSRKFVGINDKDLEKVIASTRLDTGLTTEIDKAATSITDTILKRFGLR